MRYRNPHFVSASAVLINDNKAAFDAFFSGQVKESLADSDLRAAFPALDVSLTDGVVSEIFAVYGWVSLSG